MIATHDLRIHPEIAETPHDRGVFEVLGLQGGLRRWFAYDSEGRLRIDKTVHGRDVDEGFKARLEKELDEFEERDRANADYLRRGGGALDGSSSSP
jgi:hypothetical protein